MSIKIDIYNNKREKVGDLKLSDKVFGVKVNEPLVHQAVVAQMGNERQVLAHTKQRAEVRGGGKKPWKQKGTGRARAGSTRSPIWIGGGVTFGPLKTRNFSKNINKKMKQKALLMVLSDKLESDSLTVLDKLEMKEFKTKEFDKIMDSLIITKSTLNDVKQEKKKERNKNKTAKRSVLVINNHRHSGTGEKDDKIKFSARNLEGVKLINLNNINIVDLLRYRDLIITADAVKKLEGQYK